MIKKILKGKKGISLISLTIAVMVILILTNVIILNVRDNLKIEKLKSLQTDIANLRDKVSNYYARYDTIPILDTEYTNINEIKNAGVISNVADTGKFYVIDLVRLENLTLNYGRDYDKITKESTAEQINAYKDLYIINASSHNIFYVEGVKIDGKWYYTDYLAEDVDKVPVDLKYVDGVKIPQGFNYVAGEKDTGIIISDVKGDDINNSKKGNQYVWVPVEDFDEFVRQDFGNQNISAENFVDENKADGKYFEKSGNGISTQDEVEKIYRSVKQNKGFFISRFEAGKTASGQVVSKKEENVYNLVKWGNESDEKGGAVELARSIYPESAGGELVSTLCYGVQWDAIMRWISEDSNLLGYLKDSTQIGNYSNTGTPTKTGVNDGYQIKNIYDLAGNVGEWTMENYNQNNYVIRGGDFSKTDSAYKTIASRIGGTLDYSNQTTGFRVALYINTPGINVGDYINYQPAKNADGTAKTYSRDNLVENITGSTSNKDDITQDELQWQVLWIYKDGSMDLIGSLTSQDIYFQDATGYNNGVNVMHGICEKLYSRPGITARSVTLEDMEKWLTPDGKKAKNDYIKNIIDGLAKSSNVEVVINKNTVTYEKAYSYYPNLYAKENGAGINTLTVKTDGMKDTDKVTALDESVRPDSYKQADNLTVTHTYYYIPIDSINYGEGEKALANSTHYWVASRYVNCHSDYVDFGLRHAYERVSGANLFYSDETIRISKNRLRPVVKLGPNTKIQLSETASSNEGTPHQIVQY